MSFTVLAGGWDDENAIIIANSTSSYRGNISEDLFQRFRENGEAREGVGQRGEGQRLRGKGKWAGDEGEEAGDEGEWAGDEGE